MKKALIRISAITLSLLFLFQANLVAFADNTPDWQDMPMSQEELNEILAENPNNMVSPLASDLIINYAMSISKSGNTLYVVGKTICIVSVVKSGFTVVTLKRRTSSSAQWTTYKTYEDLYDNSSSYTLSKTIPILPGYQWRIFCTHYAKKSLFSTQKIENSSNIIVS